MRRRAILLPLSAAISMSLAVPALAQEASRDRADLDAAAGRVIFQNVLLADPAAFSSRAQARTRDASPRTVHAPAATNEASADRQELDAAAGRAVFSSSGGRAVVPPRKSPEPTTKKERSVRVVSASPYGQ